jgi:gliding motility-associated-like protein
MSTLNPNPPFFKFRVLLLYSFLFTFFNVKASVAYIHTDIKPVLTIDSVKNSSAFPLIKHRPVKTFAACDNINWATWNSFTGRAATGTITDGPTTYNVTMTANYDFGSTPEIYNIAKFNGYPSPVPNRTVPKTSWTIGTGGVTEMCFSQKVTNPVLLIASLGNSAGFTARLDFSVPYVVLYSGGNMVYNSNTAISGTEGYAIIMFPGDFNCVSINSNTEEVYTNITWGLKPPPFPVTIDVTSNNCGSAILKAGGGVSYKWDGGDTPNSATNTFHASGQYVVTVTDANGCSNAATRAIAINNNTATPPTITGSPTGCASATLTASGGVTYLWDGGLTPNSATNTFNVSGNYSVLVTDANGCMTAASQLVTITPPVAAISGNNSGCNNVTLTATGGAAYLWDGGLTPTSATNTFTSSGKYTVVVTDAGGCTAQASQMVTIGPPVATISGNTSGCLSVTLTAGGGLSYVWDGGNSPSTATNTFSVGGTYHVKVTTADGCTSEASATVTLGGPVVQITEVISDCTTATLTASGGVSYQWQGGLTPNSATNTYIQRGSYKAVVTVTDAVGCSTTVTRDMFVGEHFTASYTPISCEASEAVATGGVYYHWSGGQTPDKATNVFTQSGNYTVTITDANGCTVDVHLNIIIGAPVPIITRDPAGGCGSITLTASGGTTYLWDGGSNPNSAVNTFTTSGRYSVTVTNAGGCQASTSIDVEVSPIVTPSVTTAANPSVPVCAGTTISFTATGSNEGTSPLYEWYKNDTRVATGKTYSTADLKKADEIVCKLTNSNPCAVPRTVSSEKFVAHINDKPEITVNQNLAITDDNPIQLNPTVTGDIIRYHWEPAIGLSDANVKNPVATPVVTTTYRLTATPANGCESYKDITVTVAKGIVVPNTFTPNGDGINDLWNIKHLADYPTARIEVFNRWGSPVYRSTGNNKAWDGTYKGKLMPVGTYYYVIDLRIKNVLPQTGYITLLH